MISQLITLSTLASIAHAVPTFNIGFLGPLKFQNGRFYENLFAAITAKKDFESSDAPLACDGCNSRFNIRLIAVDDSAGGAPSKDLARQGALDLMLGNKLSQWDFDPIVGLTGGQIPSNCPASVEIGNPLMVPQVAWGCAFEIGTSGQYPYFARTHQMDFPMAFAALTKYFSWKRFTIVWEPSESFSSSNSDQIMTLVAADNPDVKIKTAELRKFKDGSGPDYDDWQSQLVQAMSMHNNVWYAALSPDTSKKFFPRLIQWNILQNWMQWVVSGSCKSSIIGQLNQKNFELLGTLVIRPYSYHQVGDNWMAATIFDRVQSYGIESYRNSSTVMGLTFDPVSYGSLIKGTFDNLNKSFQKQADGNLGGGWKTNHNWPFVYDAVYSFIYAIDSLLKSGTPAEQVKGTLLKDAIALTDFQGISKHVKFSNGKRPGDWAIDNFQTKSAAPFWMGPRVGSLESGELKWKAGASVQFMDHPITQTMWSAGSTDHQFVPKDRLMRCADGQIRNTTGVCTTCPSGRYANANTWSGAQDPLREQCVLCAASTFASSPGSAQCSQCAAGKSSVLGSTTCTNCPKGSSSGVGEPCIPCKEGSFAPSEGMGSCTLAPKGTFVNYKGAVTYSACADGTVAITKGSTQCVQCMPGEYADANIECKACELGTYTESAGMSTCTQCIGGQVTLQKRAVSSSDCQCPVASYFNEVAQACQSCAGMKGVYCPGGNVVPKILQGYYAKPPPSPFDKLEVYMCGGSKACPATEVVPNLATGGEMGVRDAGVCGSNFEGLGCGRCKDDHSGNPKDGCTSCNSSGGQTRLILSTLFGFLFAPFFWFLQARTQLAPRIGVFAVLSGVIQVAITNIQVFHVLEGINIEYPAVIRSWWMSIVNFFAIDPDLLDLDCVLGQSYSARYVPKLLMLGYIWLTFITWLGVGRVINAITSKMAKVQWPMIMHCVGIMWSVFFIPISRNIFSYMQCQENPSNTKTLTRYPDVVCFESTHLSLAPLTAVAFMAFVLSYIPFVIWFITKGTKFFLTSPNFRVATKFLYGRCRPEYTYFTIVSVARNMCVALVPVIAADDSFFQGTLVALALTVYLALVSTSRPWAIKQLVDIDIVMHVLAIVLIMTGLVFIENEYRPSAAEAMKKTYYGVYLMVMQCGFCGCCVAAICHILYTHRNAYARKLREEEAKNEATIIALDFLALAEKTQNMGAQNDPTKTLPLLLHKNCVTHDIQLIRAATKVLNSISEQDGQWLRRASSLRRSTSAMGKRNSNRNSQSGGEVGMSSVTSETFAAKKSTASTGSQEAPQPTIGV